MFLSERCRFYASLAASELHGTVNKINLELPTPEQSTRAERFA